MKRNRKGNNAAPKRRKAKSPGYRTIKGVTKGASIARRSLGTGKAS
jgi:hypothetical protein